jgi:hypothetical protein
MSVARGTDYDAAVGTGSYALVNISSTVLESTWAEGTLWAAQYGPETHFPDAET